MSNSNESGKEPGTTRREFFKNTGRIAATSALAAGLAPRIYAAGSGTIKVALVGCGGRGTGAASNALSVKNGPIKLVAMADVFQGRLDRSYKNLGKGHAKYIVRNDEFVLMGSSNGTSPISMETNIRLRSPELAEELRSQREQYMKRGELLPHAP